MPTNPTPTTTPAARVDNAPVWSRATTAFAKESFDVRSREDFVSALEAFADLSAGERAFHQAHLVFRQVQALDDIHRVLVRIDQKLGAIDADALAQVKHLPAVRKALVAIARGQQDLLDLMEDAPSSPRTEGDRDPVDEDEEPDDDDHDEPDDDDDVASELADAVDADIVEEEDHGNGDQPALVPEVLTAGARREPRELTAEDVLDRHREGGGA
ncbi:MAG: hypothetical protein ACOZNI_28060 [Myxococcota bacterium]